MATPNPSSDCSDSEQPHLKVNSTESFPGGDLPASHPFHQETKTSFRGYICRQETTTFYEGCVVGSSVNNLPTVEEPEDTQSLGRCKDHNSHTEDNPNLVCAPNTGVEEDEDTDSGSKGAGADQIVTDNDQQINKNSTFRGQRIDHVDGSPVIQLVSPKLTQEQAAEERNKEERKEKSKSSEDEDKEADKQIENGENQDEGMLMGSTEQEKKDMEIKNNKDMESNKKEYVELYAQIQVYERSDDTRLPDSNEDNGKENSESHKEKEEIQINEEPQDADKQSHGYDKDNALQLQDPPEENFQLGSRSPPHPAQVLCEEQCTCEDLPACKPPENTEVTQVPEMPAMLPKDEPAEMLKTSTEGSSSVSSVEAEEDDTGSDTQTTTYVNWRQAFHSLWKRVLACLGRRVMVSSPPSTPTEKSLPTSKETQPE
ncbi:acidic repeat-containing protein-like [Heterocephalus glaber]|uniref:Acidic repeat-containing protein-like n=1 Tax=Heterocephalus glaber TaxID=10181 RepID=A0AAX6PMW1_HETGA|nr:acidic repeat-containing protein-like [Heterocephalus glaber]XP_021092476.1 acidic repeat-containing protein-like [Heterocephalus glaber]